MIISIALGIVLAILILSVGIPLVIVLGTCLAWLFVELLKNMKVEWGKACLASCRRCDWHGTDEEAKDHDRIHDAKVKI
jgi:hypothetical protein